MNTGIVSAMTLLLGAVGHVSTADCCPRGSRSARCSQSVLVIASCVTGPLMWWQRRPSGSLGAPRGRMPLRGTPALLVGLIALGIFLPFFGLSVLVVLLLDQLVIRRVPAFTARFNAS